MRFGRDRADCLGEESGVKKNNAGEKRDCSGLPQAEPIFIEGCCTGALEIVLVAETHTKWERKQVGFATTNRTRFMN